MLARRRYSERPPRDEYLLTEAGQALLPVLGALRAWGERYAGAREAPGAGRVSRGSGQPVA